MAARPFVLSTSRNTAANAGSMQEDTDLRWGLDLMLHPTFFFMERRRLKRQASGRQVAHGIVGSMMEVCMFLGLSIYYLAEVRQTVLGPAMVGFRFLAIPISLTAIVFAVALRQSISTRENIPLTWGKAWGWLLMIWALFLYEPSKTCSNKDESPFTSKEWAVFSAFISLEVLTFLTWLLISVVYPCVAGKCQSWLALRFFWRMRPSRTRRGATSYLPNGACCTLRRQHFQYEGQLKNGKPHGHGIWRDDSFHGEVLEAHWHDGLPIAPFMSRSFGSGAVSMGLCIGYGTRRAEDISGLICCPRRRSEPLRYGVVDVECSAAGAFFSHLPQVTGHRTFINLRELNREMGATSALLLEQCSSQRIRGSLPLDGANAEAAPQAAIAQSSTVALVYLHGYNCPLDWACMVLGQLLALGKFSPSIVPFVFSWPSGKTFAYVWVRSGLPTLSSDLPQFLSDLHQSGVKKVHIIAHSMGCEVLTEVLPELHRLVHGETLENFTGGTGDDHGRLHIASITFFNASCPNNRFFRENGDMQGLIAICDRLTLYCDVEDNALRFCEILGGKGPTVGRCINPELLFGDTQGVVDVIDCTSMDANVHGMRHSYFNLNPHIVADLFELINCELPAWRRSRLIRTARDGHSNIFAFLAPPAFVKNA